VVGPSTVRARQDRAPVCVAAATGKAGFFFAASRGFRYDCAIMKRTIICLLLLTPVLHAADTKKKPPATPIPAEPLTLKLGDPLSPRALMTRPTPLKGVLSWSIETRRHRGNFSCMALNPDGTRLATGGLDGTIRIWDTTNGTLVRALIGHGSYVYGLDWSPDGAVLASAGSFDATIRLWDTQTGYPLKTLKGHPSYLVQVAFAPDGRTIAGAGGESGIVSHWELATGKYLGKVELGRSVLALAWHPQKHEVAVAAAALALEICDLDSYKVDRMLGDAKTGFRCAAWSPDGKTLIAGTNDSVIVYDAEGKVMQKLEGDGAAVCWSRDGKRFAVLSSGSAKVFNAGEDKPAKTIAVVANLLQYHPEGKHIIAGDFVAFGKYDIASAQLLAREDIAGTAPPLWWSGRPLVTGLNTTKLSLWDANTGKLIRTLEGHTAAISAVTWAPDAKTLATASHDNTVRLWDPTSGKSVLTFKDHTAPVLALAFSPDGKLMASGGSDKRVLVWKVPAGVVVHKFEGHTDPVVSLAFGPTSTGMLASGSNDKTVRLWDLKKGQAGREFTETGETAAMSLAWSPDGKMLASGHYDDRVRIWQVSSGKQIHTLEERGSPPQVTSLAWAANDSLIASGRGNHTMQLWSPKTGQKLQTLATMAPVQRVAFSTGMGTVVVSSADRTTRFFDCATGGLRGVILAEDGQMILVSAEGNFKADTALAELVVVAQLEKSQETFTPAAFATKFKWQNSPSSIKLTPK
jgi:WD40 repeat protein